MKHTVVNVKMHLDLSYLVDVSATNCGAVDPWSTSTLASKAHTVDLSDKCCPTKKKQLKMLTMRKI